MNAHPQDLETLVTLIEVAALSLTTKTVQTFTYEQLWAEIRLFAGPDLALQERDVKIVLELASFMKRLPRGYYRIR